MEVPKAASPLISGLLELHRSKRFVDFTIICGTHRWEVHQVFLCFFSDVLDKACSGDFKATDKKITLSKDPPQCVNAMIMYIYKFDYEYKEYDDVPVDPMSFHVKMCIIADKYNIRGLEKLAVRKFREAAKGQTKSYEFLCAVRLAYDAMGATTTIRAIMTSIAVDDNLFEESEYWGAFEGVLIDYGCFASDVAFKLNEILRPRLAKYEGVKRFKCPSCGHHFYSDLPSRQVDAMLLCMCCGFQYHGRNWLSNFQVEDDGFPVSADTASFAE